MENPIQNPLGVAGLTLSFLVAISGLAALLWQIPAEIIGAINLVLASGVGLVAEIVRRK